MWEGGRAVDSQCDQNCEGHIPFITSKGSKALFGL